MKEMTSAERFARMFEHKEADRVPVIDSPWKATIERWVREGMPENVSFVDYFGLDRTDCIVTDNSPRYPTRVVSETEDTIVEVSSWGVTLKNFKHAASTPEYLDFTIVSPDTWEKAKARIQPDHDRINWTYIKDNYARWKKEGYWVEALLWFGFDITHAWIIGTERMLRALLEEPEWCMDMFSHLLEVNLALLDQVWDAGYHFDGIFWPDDMGFKHNQFFSLGVYRELLKPYHQRAIDWAHAKGIKARLHSCGDVNPFVPVLVSMGLDGLNPLEVKAGMDPIALKKKFGKNLLLHGGINAVLWDKPEEIEAEMRRVIPAVKENGGYIFSSDHSVPSSVSLEDFRRITNLAKQLGSYA